jgi:hypothetical protein
MSKLAYFWCREYQRGSAEHGLDSSDVSIPEEAVAHHKVVDTVFLHPRRGGGGTLMGWVENDFYWLLWIWLPHYLSAHPILIPELAHLEHCFVPET